MKAETKSLQKLTETKKKIELLLSKKKITQDDVKNTFTENESNEFAKYLTDKINNVKGEERDKFLNKIDDIIPKDTKNQLWENNHVLITHAISKYIEEYGKMPPRNSIATESGLSRQTVYKHLKEYDSHPFYTEEIKKFRFMADRVLAKTFKLAVNGDSKAARLYLEAVGFLHSKSHSSKTINTQNNYIQINGKVISQESIKSLNPEQLNAIESVLNDAVPLNC